MIEFRRLDVAHPGVVVYNCEECGSITNDIQGHIDWHRKIFNQMRYLVPVDKRISEPSLNGLPVKGGGEKITWTLQELIDGGIITSRRILRKEP